ncbi:hypothetical protein OH77DRAFT_1427906 [Trametes cingulata]|nr:hypothetical protein OH77DRAFT_1427906 [Trametes cingulata]
MSIVATTLVKPKHPVRPRNDLYLMFYISWPGRISGDAQKQKSETLGHVQQRYFQVHRLGSARRRGGRHDSRSLNTTRSRVRHYTRTTRIACALALKGARNESGDGAGPMRCRDSATPARSSLVHHTDKQVNNRDGLHRPSVIHAFRFSVAAASKSSAWLHNETTDA